MFFWICLFTLSFMTPMYAESGYVGESIYLYAPSVPGTIGGAAWSANSSNIVVSGDHYGATATIWSYFSGTVTITCQYTYSYYVGGKRYYSGTQYAYYYISCRSSTLALNKREVTLKPGQEIELSYTNSSGYTPLSIMWTTSNKKVATVDGYEKVYDRKSIIVTAEDVGECIITCEGFTGGTAPTCKVIVKGDPPTAISVNPDRLILQEGKNGKFTYEMTPSDAYTKITWSSSNESIVKVSSNGQVTAISQGTARITATTDNGLSAYGTVEVTPQPKQVSILSSQQTTIGYTFKLVPTLTPSNATTTYKWETADSKIAVVDDTGRVRGKTAGSTTITVSTENGKTSSCRVTVKSPSDGMDYRNADIRLKTVKNLINMSLSNIK